MNPIIGCFLDFQFLSVAFNQIVDVVQVKLEEADPHSKLPALHLLLDLGENVGYRSVEVALFVSGNLRVFAAEDCVGLACASLPIGQKCGIVAFKHRVY